MRQHAAAHALKGLVAVLALLIGPGMQAKAAEGCGPYRVALYKTGLLYFKDEAGSLDGIDKRLLDELARRTGCRFHTFAESRVRTWSALAGGSLDMTVAGVETPERRAFATFIPYVAHNRYFLIVKKRPAARLSTMRDFEQDKSLRLGVVKGCAHGAELDQWVLRLKSQGRVEQLGDFESLARVFAAGRVDALLTQPLVWSALFRRRAMVDQVNILDIAPRDSAALGLVLARGRVSRDNIELLRAGVADMRADGTLQGIFARFVDAPTAKAFASSAATPCNAVSGC